MQTVESGVWLCVLHALVARAHPQLLSAPRAACPQTSPSLRWRAVCRSLTVLDVMYISVLALASWLSD